MGSEHVNKQWFLETLEYKRASQSDLARFLNVDKSALSRMLSGERKMQLHEATSIANFLSVPVSEVLKHAGASVDVAGHPTRILLTSVVNEVGSIERLKEPRQLPQKLIDSANQTTASIPGKIMAAQIRASQGALAVMDDALLLFQPTKIVLQESIGVLSICRLHDGEHILAKIESVRKTGEAHIVRTSGQRQEVILHTSTPVFAILP